MAMAYLHRLLIWALSVQLANTCLCCWPDVAKYFSYDVQRLVGGNKDVVEKLEQLFMESSSGKCAIYGGKFLERDDMEREAGYLFLQLQHIVQKYGKDTEQLMTEAGREKQNFSRKLEKASAAFVKEICSASCGQIRFQPYELADCGGCRLVKAPCKDSLVCAGPNVLAGVLVTLVILLGAGAGVWYYRRKKAGEGAREDVSTESSEDSGSSEWSDDTDIASPPPDMTPKKAKASDPPYQMYQTSQAHHTKTYQELQAHHIKMYPFHIQIHHLLGPHYIKTYPFRAHHISGAHDMTSRQAGCNKIRN